MGLWWKTTFSVFWLCFYIYLNALQYDNTLFSVALFYISNSALFLYIASAHRLHRRSLDTFYWDMSQLVCLGNIRYYLNTKIYQIRGIICLCSIYRLEVTLYVSKYQRQLIGVTSLTHFVMHLSESLARWFMRYILRGNNKHKLSFPSYLKEVFVIMNNPVTPVFIWCLCRNADQSDIFTKFDDN